MQIRPLVIAGSITASNGITHLAHTIIFSTGSAHRTLGAPNEND